jgi:hypothetical protein
VVDPVGQNWVILQKIDKQIRVPEDFGQKTSYQSVPRMRSSMSSPKR